MTSVLPNFRSMWGKDLGLGNRGQLVTRGDGTPVDITNKAVDAVITFTGSPPTSGYGINIQLNGADGLPIAFCQPLRVRVVADANGAALATTGGSTGIAIGAAGKIEKAVTAKLIFEMCTDITGLISLTWTDDAGEVAYLAVTLPNGRTVFSAALTTA